MSSSPPTSRRIDHEADGDGTSKRRRRGAARLSCAECRRLKLRCDRKVPCDSCVKRGCGAICPDGSLTTGKGNRFVLASTQELHEKILELASRVRDLEDALRTSHSQLSKTPHHLLSEELLRIKAPLQRELPAERDAPAAANGGGIKEEPDQDAVDSFGSLSISQSGRTKYYGHVANSWYFLQNETQEEEQDDRLTALDTGLPPDILALGAAFPPTSSPRSPVGSENDRLQSLFWYLPAVHKATEIRDIYYQRAAWMYNPIPRGLFNEQVFSYFYNPETTLPPDDTSGSHRLSLMFMVLAIGTLLDVKQEAYNLEAEKYHQLARAALFHSSMFDDPTLHAVQALFLMTYYFFLADRHGKSSGSRWIIMGIAVKLGQSIGLHRDSARWGIDADETRQRSETFWEMFTYDSWQCMTFGRPPSFSLAHVDCKLPYPNEDITGERTFDTWKHRFSSECMSVVHDQAFGAKTPNYQTILQLDRKLRNFPVPAILQVAGFGSSDPALRLAHADTLSLIMQRHIVLAIREMNLLYMHRGFFARAISDHPKDPLGSPYGTSVIAAYRSAGSLVALVRSLDSQYPEPTERLWFLWTHLFSCTIVLGSIVTRCPSMSLAPSALLQLDSACELFSKVARQFRAEQVLKIMLGLRQKAHHSLRDFREAMASPQQGPGSFMTETGSPIGPDEDDELTKLGGKTRLISPRDPSSRSPSFPLLHPDRSPTSMNPVVPLPLPNFGEQDVHPNMLNYLQSFTRTSTSAQMGAGVPVGQPMYQSSGQAMYDVQPSVNESYIPHNMSPISYHIPENRSSRLSNTTDVSPTSATSIMSMTEMQPQPSQSMTQMFPQYFPVFDYGNAAAESAASYAPMNGHTNGSGTSNGHGYSQGYGNYANGQMMHDVQSGGYVNGEGRTTPEGGIQNSWADFVAQMSMNSG